MIIQIKNSSVCKPDCSGFEKRDLFIENGRIIECGTDMIPDRVIDAEGKYIIPGLIDIHTHGAVGCEYTSEWDFDDLLLFEAGQGVTTVLPTVSTRDEDVYVSEIKHVLNQKKRRLAGADIGGIHLEGPFLSHEKRGAILEKPWKCEGELFQKLYDAGEGEIRVMTIAPELDGALDIIREGAKRGVHISLGHTDATYEEAMAGIEAGATGATHTFNAMRSFNHRDTGVLGAVLTDERVVCEAICDMVHLSPAAIKLIRRAKGIDGMILISDSLHTAGLPDGEYLSESGEKMIAKDGVVRLLSGTISGSCFTMADGARKLIGEGFSLCEIAKIGSLNPARAIGLDSDRGSIESGKRADLIICDKYMNVSRVLVGGAEAPLSPQGFAL